MGYKLAGYEVLGCNEIDKKMMAIYEANHHPKYAFLEGIQTFKDRDDLPEELCDLDILDGSPPCSSFSMAGNREEDWGKEKIFREGQELQVLDTLFFDFIDLAKKLQPKVVISENVKGMLIGDAVGYVARIHQAFEEAGYKTTHMLLNAADMGVPQRRERVFFISVRKDLAEKHMGGLFGDTLELYMDFNEQHIPFSQIEDYEIEEKDWRKITPGFMEYYPLMQPGQTLSDVHPKGTGFQVYKLDPTRPLPTLRAGANDYMHPRDMRVLSKKEILRGSSFPTDFDFLKSQPIYVCGMSVPPVMMAQVANEVYQQILSHLPLPSPIISLEKQV